MAPNSIPHLCGGILFGLLLEARKPRSKARNKLNGGSDGLTAPAIYAGLIHIVLADEYLGDSTLEKCASNYKKCESSKGSYVPFTNASTVSAFHSSVQRKDPDIYNRVSEFIDNYLSVGKYEWLIRALIDLLQSDKGIDSDTEIAINYSETMKVSDLHTVNEVILQPFLISVIDFVLQYSPDAESGRPTFETLYSQSSPKAEWKYREDNTLGNRIPPINVKTSMPDIPSKESVPKNSESSTNNTSTSIITDEYIDPTNQNDDEIITEPLTKALSIFADALAAQKHQMAEQIRKNQRKQIDEDLFDSFKAESEEILQYCISKDITGEPIRLELSDEITGLVEKWQFQLRKISDTEKRSIIASCIKTLSEYAYYLSDKYLRYNENIKMLHFRCSSSEERQQLVEDLRPNSLRLRNELAILYKKLWPAPEIDEEKNTETEKTDFDPASNSDNAKTIQQTVVNQYGDNPIMINHVENINIKGGDQNG